MEGRYINVSTSMSDSLRHEWEVWLDTQRDPGLWDSYKERDQRVLPYIDGHPQWVTEAWMPEHLYTKFRQEQSAK